MESDPTTAKRYLRRKKISITDCTADSRWATKREQAAQMTRGLFALSVSSLFYDVLAKKLLHQIGNRVPFSLQRKVPGVEQVELHCFQIALVGFSIGG
jgi:hypothetical protein